MIRRPPRSTLDRSSAASDVYKRQAHAHNIFLQTALDVGLPGLIVYLALLLLAFWLGWQVARGDETLRPFAPVSYTHLRAHETVLDLVCRLLLEKKKTREHEIRIAHELTD